MAGWLVVLRLTTAQRWQNTGKGKRDPCTISEEICGQHGKKSPLMSVCSWCPCSLSQSWCCLPCDQGHGHVQKAWGEFASLALSCSCEGHIRQRPASSFWYPWIFRLVWEITKNNRIQIREWELRLNNGNICNKCYIPKLELFTVTLDTTLEDTAEERMQAFSNFWSWDDNTFTVYNKTVLALNTWNKIKWAYFLIICKPINISKAWL